MTPIPRRWQVAVALIAIALVADAGARSAPLQAQPFFFIQFSDPQFGMSTNDKEFVHETANFEFAIAAANRLRPAFVIVTGDLVNKPGDAAQIAEYRRIAAKLDPAIPLYNVAGNHDVGNTPTAASVAAYVEIFGPDRYTFTSGPLFGIVLNSSLIKAPDQAAELAAAQEQWLRDTLAAVRRERRELVVVFQHHPWFLSELTEADQYFNIPRARRERYMGLFRESGVKYLFSGHYHRNAGGRDGDLEMITTGPVGMPQGGAKSGIRVGVVRGTAVEHRYFEFGEIPTRIDLSKPLPR